MMIPDSSPITVRRSPVLFHEGTSIDGLSCSVEMKCQENVLLKPVFTHAPCFFFGDVTAGAVSAETIKRSMLKFGMTSYSLKVNSRVSP